MTEDFLVFGSPLIQEDEIDEVVNCLRSAWIGTGPRVAHFENAFAQYKSVEHVAAVNSCTAGLHLSVVAAGLGPGDEVITTPLTFCATVNAIMHAGATPVLADVDPFSMNLDPVCVRERITSRTRAIVPVHFAGRPCDMDAFTDLAREYNLAIIEDCAHAIETQYHGRKAGTFGDFGCFSFYATKNMTTGEGGMVIAKTREHIDVVKTLALHGMSRDAWRRFSDEGYKHYLVTNCGFKYNMMDIQAALGIHQLRRLEANWLRRQEVWRRYTEAFRDLPITIPEESAPGTRHAYHLYTVLIRQESGIERDEFLNRMTALKIGVGVHYLSVPEHPFYQRHFGWRVEEFPHSMRIGRETVSLPLSARLSDADVDRVIHGVREILSSASRTFSVPVVAGAAAY